MQLVVHNYWDVNRVDEEGIRVLVDDSEKDDTAEDQADDTLPIHEVAGPLCREAAEDTQRSKEHSGLARRRTDRIRAGSKNRMEAVSVLLMKSCPLIG
jgi:hypothetical protein